jgi:hypothetical protein
MARAVLAAAVIIASAAIIVGCTRLNQNAGKTITYLRGHQRLRRGQQRHVHD